MNDSQYLYLQRNLDELRDELAAVKKDIAEVRSRMVTKIELVAIKSQSDSDHITLRNQGATIALHHEAYRDWLKGKKWVQRVGIATLVSAWLSPHLKAIFDAVKVAADFVSK